MSRQPEADRKQTGTGSNRKNPCTSPYVVGVRFLLPPEVQPEPEPEQPQPASPCAPWGAPHAAASPRESRGLEGGR